LELLTSGIEKEVKKGKTRDALEHQ